MFWSERTPLLAGLMAKITAPVSALRRASPSIEVQVPSSRTRRDSSAQVHLIGTGPGAADLLTLRAYHLIRNADVAIYDRLVSEEILDMLPANCERYYVGKAPGHHSVTQAKIGELMVEQAQRGKTVMRLKGGDPAIFARMAEEIAALDQAKVDWRIVPGITAASGCASAAGIPLTDRAVAHQVRFITATRYSDALSHDWETLAKPDQTLVFYMGLDALPTISSALQEHGVPSNWPILLIENGTRSNQRNLLSTLDKVMEESEAHAFRTPSLIIVGEVVRNAKKTEQLVATVLSAT